MRNIVIYLDYSYGILQYHSDMNVYDKFRRIAYTRATAYYRQNLPLSSIYFQGVYDRDSDLGLGYHCLCF